MTNRLPSRAPIRRDQPSSVPLTLHLAPDLSVTFHDPVQPPATTGLLAAPVWKLVIKRLIDVVVACFALLVLAPVVAAAAVSIKLTSQGPVLYRSARIGQHGEPFSFLKLRTMWSEADRHRPATKTRHDPRITPVGRVLRRTSIDETPQLLHVLSGRMSLVGPRPQLPEEVAGYQPEEVARLLVKPGITGFPQVHGRSELDLDTWRSLDLEYIENWSLLLDAEILVKTVKAVAGGRGAY